MHILFIQSVLKLKIIMSTSPQRKSGISPIRNLQEKSPYRSRKLRTILEEDNYQIRTPTITPSNPAPRYTEIQNRIYRQRVKELLDKRYTPDLVSLQNSRLRRENQILKEKNYQKTSDQFQNLNRELILANTENQNLRNDIMVMKNEYEKQVSALITENSSLKKQIVTLEQKMFMDTQKIKEKYQNILTHDISAAKNAYVDDLGKVLESLQKTKALLIEKENQVSALTRINQEISNQYNAHLQSLISENNIVRNKVNYTQIKLNNEVKQAETQKQLEKSRTHGLLSYCRQSTAYMEKEVHKLAEELLQKNISIQTFTKDILKLKRNLELTERRYEHKLTRAEEEKMEKIKQIQTSMQKMQKFYKEQIAELNKKQMELCEVVASRENQIENLKRQIEHQKHIVEQKDNQLEELKANLNKMHEDHAKEISKVMSQSQVRRRSMKNLSELSSLRDLSGEGTNSQIRKSILRRDSIDPPQDGSNGQLGTVQQQITKSHFLPGGSEDDEDIDIKELILHYENMIQQLKSNKMLELKLANDKIDQLNQNLQEKQQQILEILERFSPLMEYKINANSLEEERKQKIEKHIKADIGLLEVILGKHKIGNFGVRD